MPFSVYSLSFVFLRVQGLGLERPSGARPSMVARGGESEDTSGGAKKAKSNAEEAAPLLRYTRHLGVRAVQIKTLYRHNDLSCVRNPHYTGGGTHAARGASGLSV